MDDTTPGWTWTPSIGLFYGHGPQGQRETISRPVMTSPWWTVGDDWYSNQPTPVYPDGTTTPIFATVTAAAQHVTATTEGKFSNG